VNVMTAKKTYPAFNSQLLQKLGVSINNLVSDSRKVKPGDTFLAYAGDKYDARQFIPQAIAAGANAVLWERQDFSWNPKWKLPALSIAELKIKSGFIASHVYDNPSQQLQLIGITGTNGKTSCSHWLAQAMAVLNKKTAVIGTLGQGFPGELRSTENTTPDAILTQKALAEYLSKGADSVVMEVSSHGIAQGRINGSTFDIAILTNLTRDHMDYHQSMDQYAATKAKLFFWPQLKYAVLNLDDVFGVELSQQLSHSNTQVLGYGFKQPKIECPSSNNPNVLYGSNLVASLQGLSFDVEFEGRCKSVKTNLIGRFNASNLLAVLAALIASGFKFSEAVKAVQQVQPIAGRMEKFGGGEQPVVIVDYAHTPDAIEKVLVTLREMLQSSSQPSALKAKLFCVLGCGGNRDQGKRGVTGEVVTRLADEVIFTSDNPRHESPQAIIEEMVADAHPGYHIEEDRAAAIHQVIRRACVGDIVLIAGKGHETYQEIKGKKIRFSDREVVLQELMAEGVPQK
jgi:UDP-N-acetylmuramoyl-L-alanyl-D-glutamate--2,6-diaminopimelate ligase